MQTYSRKFLQEFPEKKKQSEIDAMILSFIRHLYKAAEDGETSYFFDMTNMINIVPDTSQTVGKRKLQTAITHINQTTMTNVEIVNRFGNAFPDCKVVYNEDWVESNAMTKVLKRGITIDWS